MPNNCIPKSPLRLDDLVGEVSSKDDNDLIYEPVVDSKEIWKILW